MKWRNAVLLLFNLIFYGWGEPKYILIMFASIAIDYTHGILVTRCKEQMCIRDSSASPTPGLTRKKDTWTVLLAASDQSSGNADTIMVGMYDTVNQQAGLVSIPRDTIYRGTTPDGGHYYKINSTYAYYGADGLRQAVSEMLGIPIDHYLTIDLSGFKAIVNAVDGIDFNVPVRMRYDDPVQDLHIRFDPGMTHLDGQEAMEICRFRHNNANETQVAYTDVDRTRTQQQVLTLIAKKVLSNPQKVEMCIRDRLSTYSGLAP